MLVVIGIIGIVAAISVPAIKNMRTADMAAAATRQLQDEMSRARQFAMTRRTTVYMVFVPGSFFTDPQFGVNYFPADWLAATNLLDKQWVGYNFITLRDVGAQPGQFQPRYLEEWRTLPEGTFVAGFKFAQRNVSTTLKNSAGVPLFGIPGFAWTNNLPFPRAETLSPTGTYPWLPYIAFNHLGQLESDLDAELIPLARGHVIEPLDANKQPTFNPATLEEVPPGNSTNSAFTLIYVDRLTGRAHVERQKIQ
jgi:type II secretory pathway pseudopilin PulG